MVILGFLLTAFAVVYYVGPNVEQSFRFISPGAVLGVGVLILAALGFRFTWRTSGGTRRRTEAWAR